MFDQGFRAGHGPGGWRRPSHFVVPNQPCGSDDHNGFKRITTDSGDGDNLGCRAPLGEPRPCETLHRWGPAPAKSCHEAIGALGRRSKLGRSKLAPRTGAISCPIKASDPNQISETICPRGPGRHRGRRTLMWTGLSREPPECQPRQWL